MATPRLFAEQSPQEDVLDVAPAVDDGEYVHLSLIDPIEQTPRRDYEFSVAAYVVTFQLRNHASKTRLGDESRDRLIDPIHEPERRTR